MKHLLLILALFCTLHVAAQTTNISIPAASGGGIKLVLPARLGINLDDSASYGPGQLTANLIAPGSSDFVPQIWMEVSGCASSGATTTNWPDNNIYYSTQPANFWQGATYQVTSGVDTGATGTVTANTAAVPGVIGQQLTLSPPLSSPCSGANGGDGMILRCRTPLGTCAGGYTAANSLASPFASGGASFSFETTDLSPSSTSPQGMELIAPTGTAQTISYFDETLGGVFGGGVWINLNGSYTLTFRAKATAGAPSLRYYVSREGGTPWLVNSVMPTVNSTPGAGWTNYSFTFTASETGAQASVGVVNFQATGGTVLLQDVALTEATTGSNTTAFRDAVYQKLLALQPGTLRYMTGAQWGCTLDNMIAASPSLCGYNNGQPYGNPINYNLNQFLYLAASVGANPWWTFSAYATTTDMANTAAYFNAPCSSGNSYAAIRCNFLAGTAYAGMTWTQVFAACCSSSAIYLEMGNEIWNSPNGENLTYGGGVEYGQLLGNNVAAFKAAPYYAGNMHIVGSGFIDESSGFYGWNGQVLTAACGITNGCPDFIDGAPYIFAAMTDLSLPNLWTSMFAEPVNYNTLSSGSTYSLQNYAQTTFGVQGSVYETNVGTSLGLTGVTQAQLWGVTGSVASGLDATLNMMLAARDAGIKVQNFFALPELSAPFSTATSIFAGSATPDSSVYAAIWGSSRYISGPGNTNNIDRPSGIMLQGINQAIGSKLNLLNTVQTGTPTYNQPAAQPDPTSGQMFTGTTTMGSDVVTGVGFGGGACGWGCLGQPYNTISGTGIPSGTSAVSINPGANTVTLSQNATAGGSNTFGDAVYNIAPNSAVPYVQAFGFGDGLGNYSVIAYNLDSVSSHAITFSGSGAPTGTCTKTVFTSTNITDNNESVFLDGTPLVSYPSPTTDSSCYTGDTLPPYSMVTYTYSTSTAQTWYVRQDGAGRYDAARVAAGFTGAAIGCDGLADVAYPGSGTNQHCAFGDFRFLYDDQTYMNWPNWVIAGGDTVIVRGCAAITANSTTTGQAAGLGCRIGYDFAGPCSGAGCGAGYTWCYGVSPCGSPPPPSGSAGHPTIIEGGCAPSCSTGTPNTTTLRPNQAVLPELYALYGLNTVFDTSGTNYLTVDGLFIDAHDNCIKHISPSVSPCSTTAPYSQFADEGIRRDPSTNNLTLTDVLIVGMQDSALIGPMNGTETFNDVELAYNGFTGDNYDDGTHSQSGGVITRNNFTVIWTGCPYNYGSSYAIPITYCADDSSSGNGDGTATPSVSHDTFVNTWETMAYNTQDGDDVGHNQDPGSAAWYNSISYGNEGGSFKSGGESATLINILSNTQCRRMAAAITGAPSTFNTYLSDFCRAGGDGVGVNFLGGGSGETISIINSSIIGYGGTMVDAQIQGGGSCSGCTFNFKNNAVMGYVNPSYSSTQPQMWNTVTPNSPTYNLYYNLSSCPAAGTGEVCTSPLWVGQPATPTTDSGLDNFDFYPTNPGSPLIHGGGGGGLTPVADYFGVATTSPPVIGAVNAMAAVGFSTITSGHVIKSGHTITQ